MKLTDASAYFDVTEATSPWDGSVLFYGQIGPYDDSKRDASTAYRRVLSVAPGTPMPPDKTIVMMGVTWLVGGLESDALIEIHRDKYVIEQAPYIGQISHLTDFLVGTVLNTTYISANWVKDAKQLETSSQTPQIFDVRFPSGTDVRVHDIIWNTGFAYLVLAPHEQPSGYMVANCLQLDQQLPVTASVTSRTYNPVTGSYTSTAPVSVPALKVRWQSMFQYISQMSERYQEGDAALVVPVGTVVTTSTAVTLAGVNYQVLAVMNISGAAVLHVRVR